MGRESANISHSEKDAWFAGQREALAAALNDAPVSESLAILVRTATAQLGPGVRAAFYLANAEGTALHHVVGMTPDYAKAVDGFPIGPESLSCGLAVHTGQPILTADVNAEPLWADWRWLAAQTGFRGCWSFPIHTRVRNFVGTLAIYWPEPCEATDWHCELADTLTQAAGIIVARHIDLESRKRSELRLAQERNLLAGIFETTPECIKIVARDGTLLQMNPAGREMVEASTPAQLEGACIFDVIAPEHREYWKSNHEKVCDGERLSWEFDIVGFRGTRRHMETHAAPIQMPDGTSAQLAITRDVTKRHQDDQRIKDSELRFEQLLQALPAAVYTTDADGRITFYNDAAVELAGRKPELGEKWCVTWRLLNADGSLLPHDQCPLAVALKEQRPVRDIEAIAERPDGSRRWFVPYPTPLRDANGVMNGAINMLVDITQRKNAERQQRLLIDELNHRVKNTLATVQSIITQTAKNAVDVDDYRRAIQDRIMAMSRAHNQLSRNNWNGADLNEIMRSGLEAYLEKGRFVFSGEPISVPPRAALMLSMIFNELATNAAKYGALSCEGGNIKLEWAVKANGAGPVLRLHWCESGGPNIIHRTRTGFGMRLIERGVEGELGGKAVVDFAPSGLRCEINIPLAHGLH
jgi:PAS domain S-box-containing protein